MAVLVWIATRIFQRTQEEAPRTILWVDRNLAIYRGHYPWPQGDGDSTSTAKLKLSDALADGKLSGRATKLSREWKWRPYRHGLEKLSEDAESDCEFPPADDRGLLRKLIDSENDAILWEQQVEGQMRSIDWRDLTFARADVLRLWPEHPQAIAYRLAKATPWTPPEGLAQTSLALLPEGKRVALGPVVTLLAFGALEPPADLSEPEIIAARMRATYALLVAARDEEVILWGTPAARREHLSHWLEASGPRGRMLPAEFDNDALALSHQKESSLGTEAVAANYPTRGGASDGVKWFGVTVEISSLATWLARLAKPTLEAVLREAANQNGRGTLTQKEAIAIAKDNGVFLSREKTVEALKSLGIEGKQGRREKPQKAG